MINALPTYIEIGKDSRLYSLSSLAEPLEEGSVLAIVGGLIDKTVDNHYEILGLRDLLLSEKISFSVGGDEYYLWNEYIPEINITSIYKWDEGVQNLVYISLHVDIPPASANVNHYYSICYGDYDAVLDNSLVHENLTFKSLHEFDFKSAFDSAIRDGSFLEIDKFFTDIFKSSDNDIDPYSLARTFARILLMDDGTKEWGIYFLKNAYAYQENSYYKRKSKLLEVIMSDNLSYPEKELASIDYLSIVDSLCIMYLQQNVEIPSNYTSEDVRSCFFTVFDLYKTSQSRIIRNYCIQTLSRLFLLVDRHGFKIKNTKAIRRVKSVVNDFDLMPLKANIQEVYPVTNSQAPPSHM